MGRINNRLAAAILILIAVVGLLIPVTQVQAASSSQNGFNLTTSPTPVLLKTAPGSTVTTTLRVINTGQQTEHLKVGLMKFGASGDTGRPDLYDRGPNDTYFDWVSFSPASFDAPIGQWQDVKMTIKVPKTASLGYYYAVTFQRANDPTNTKSTSVIGATATLVLLDTKTGNENFDVKIDKFTSDHGFYQYLPATFNVRVHNTGNIFLAPTGNIFIKRGDHTIATLDVNPYQGNVLPNSYRVFSAEWKDGFPQYVDKQANGKPVLTKSGAPDRDLHWNFSQLSKLRFGKYTAQALVVYNDGNRDVPLQATVSFWVIPWTFIFGILLVVALVVAGIWTILRGTWRKARYRTRK